MPEPQNIDGIGAAQDGRARLTYYRDKASECLERAEKTTDGRTRNYLLGLANTWTRLAMIPERIKPV